MAAIKGNKMAGIKGNKMAGIKSNEMAGIRCNKMEFCCQIEIANIRNSEISWNSKQS